MTAIPPPPKIVYFHGQPGGVREWQFFAPEPLQALVLDRNAPRTVADLVQDIENSCGKAPLTLIGFSLGAPVALSVAASLSDRVASIHLISPAAPLQLGAFLQNMAGGSLFRIAKSNPFVFRLIAKLQGLLARFAPNLLMGLMFAHAAGEDLVLSKDPAFCEMISKTFREGLGRNQNGFAGEVIDYVADWTSSLAKIKVPVKIWQGEKDNWTPPEMAIALADGLNTDVTLNLLRDCSHYSALRHFLESEEVKCLVQDTLELR